jgi:hypothetical protein
MRRGERRSSERLAVDNRAMDKHVEFNAPVVDGEYRVSLRVSDADSTLAGQCLTNLLGTTAWLAEDLVTGTQFELDAGASTLQLAAHDALLLRPLQHRTGSVH